MMALLGTGCCLYPPSVWQSPGCLPHRHVSLPAQDHEGLAIVLTAAQALGVGFQDSQPQLENGFDPIVEEAIHNAHRTLERHNAEEQSQEPRERDGR